MGIKYSHPNGYFYGSYFITCDDPHDEECENKIQSITDNSNIAISKALEQGWEIKLGDTSEEWFCPKCVKKLIITTTMSMSTKETQQFLWDISESVIGTTIILSDHKGSISGGTWEMTLKFANKQKLEHFLSSIEHYGQLAIWKEYFCEEEITESASM